MTIQQISDFLAEADELDRLLGGLSASDWQRPTQFKDWTINDVVLHLHASDVLAYQSTVGVDAFKVFRESMLARRAALGMSFIEESRDRFPGLTGQALRQQWRKQVTTLCDALDRMDPDSRLPWVALPMGLRMFVTARQMETWAHGLSIYDVLGLERTETDRIRSIAVIGVKTFGFTFANRKLQVPPELPYVRLQAPSGAIWEYNDPASSCSVKGSAVEFCQVVTQVRNHADTRLTIEGETAQRWMSMAQCFAGPPQDPPAGTRYRVVAA